MEMHIISVCRSIYPTWFWKLRPDERFLVEPTVYKVRAVGIQVLAFRKLGMLEQALCEAAISPLPDFVIGWMLLLAGRSSLPSLLH